MKMKVLDSLFKPLGAIAVLLLTMSTSLMTTGTASAQVGSPLPTIYIIGDSTVHNPMTGLCGWGDVISKQFDLTKVNVENDAIGGRSSRTFTTEGHWATVLAKVKPGDFVLMQFGHNDGGSVVTSYRASLKGIGDDTQVVTNPKTNQQETVHTYGWYMKQYIEQAKAKGASPIIFSPIPRDIWSADGKTVDRNMADFGGWSEQVAEAENIPFVNLNAIVADKYDVLGFPKVKAAYFPGDHTHTSPAGAELNAESVVQGLKALPNDPVAPYLLPGAPITFSN